MFSLVFLVLFDVYLLRPDFWGGGFCVVVVFYVLFFCFVGGKAGILEVLCFCGEINGAQNQHFAGPSILTADQSNDCHNSNARFKLLFAPHRIDQA